MGNSRTLLAVAPADAGLGDRTDVAVLAAPPATTAAGTAVPARDLVEALDALPVSISVVVVVDRSTREWAERIPAAVDAFASGGIAALIDHVPATEAVKRVADGYVVAGVDRSTLIAPRCPQVFDRDVLAEGLTAVDRGDVVHPAAVIADAGGVVRLLEQPPS